LEATTLELVCRSGMREYFDPLTGAGRGAADFSWTAAAVLDIAANPGGEGCGRRAARRRAGRLAKPI
ncbi:MAG TPA: hypothetical protein VKA57_00860, partial [Solirubrobacteraceae bacterium]|nr:hypothetical protein [Solirubrobacteraceae bacterium]